ETSRTLNESRHTLVAFQSALAKLNQLLGDKSTQQIPKEMQKTLYELNQSIKGFQPGSTAYNKMVADMQQLDKVLRELQPILNKLNKKSNALVFEAKEQSDPLPKRAKE